jgi:hypothetical protein
MAWEPATVVNIQEETSTATTVRLRLPPSPTHLAGQHYIIRLAAPDGHTATRSYSVVPAPDRTALINRPASTVGRPDVAEPSWHATAGRFLGRHLGRLGCHDTTMDESKASARPRPLSPTSPQNATAFELRLQMLA